jgi:hypothetical protein
MIDVLGLRMNAGLRFCYSPFRTRLFTGRIVRHDPCLNRHCRRLRT